MRRLIDILIALGPVALGAAFVAALIWLGISTAGESDTVRASQSCKADFTVVAMGLPCQPRRPQP